MSEAASMTDHTTRALVLVDDPDGCPESTCWVEALEGVTPDDAIRIIEDIFPPEDREETEHYHCEEEQTFMCPDSSEPDMETQWHHCEEGAIRAVKFWVITVVCEL